MTPTQATEARMKPRESRDDQATEAPYSAALHTGYLAEVITQQDHNRVLYWTVAGRVWKAAIKTTAAKDELYLLSLHPANPKDIKRQVPPEHWSKLGVA